MAGHSKWKQIKRKKGVTDARRGQLFTKLAREITVAAREGGSDTTANFRLRLAIQRARDQNMPVANIERATKRGSGEGAAHETFAAVTYEGYAPGGAAILVEAMTDNRNRTVSEVRRVFSRLGGNMGEAGSVGWLFQSTGVISGDAPAGAAEAVALAAIDAGADDVKTDGDSFEVYAAHDKIEPVRAALEKAGAAIASAELQMVPKSPMPLDPAAAERTLRLLDSLEELDDVNKVYTNADFPEAVLAHMAKAS
jgi:YebC/PmpR family DNA-binding regulatory protein